MSRNLPLLALLLSLAVPPSAKSIDLNSRPAIGGVSIRPFNLAGRGVSGGSSSGHYDRFQPDNWIGTRRGRQTGNNVYNANGSRQRTTVKIRSRRSARFYFTVQNDYHEVDHLTVNAPRRNRDHRLSYYQLGSTVTDVTPSVTTSSVTTSGYRSDSLSSGATRDYRVRVKPLRRSTRRGNLRGIFVKTVSDASGHARDCVKADFKRY